jgi:hypothetical protein
VNNGYYFVRTVTLATPPTPNVTMTDARVLYRLGRSIKLASANIRARLEAVLGFTILTSATAFDNKHLRSLAGVTRSVYQGTSPQPEGTTKVFTYAHCLLDRRKMSPSEREQMPQCTRDAWGTAYVVGTIVRFVQVERDNAHGKHVIAKVLLYPPPPPPLPAVDPSCQLLVVDRSRGKTCFFHPRSLGPVVALGAGVPGFPPGHSPHYWSVLRVDNP